MCWSGAGSLMRAGYKWTAEKASNVWSRETSRAEFDGVARFKQKVVAAQKFFGINGNALALAHDENFAGRTVVQSLRCGDGLRERQTVSPNNLGVSHVADDPDVHAARFTDLLKGLALAGEERGLRLLVGFRFCREAARQKQKAENKKQKSDRPTAIRGQPEAEG